MVPICMRGFDMGFIMARLSRFAIGTSGETAGAAMVTAAAILPVLRLKESHWNSGAPKPVAMD